MLCSNYFPGAQGSGSIQNYASFASGKDHISATLGHIEFSCLLIDNQAMYADIGFYLDVKYSAYGDSTNGRHSFTITKSVPSGYLLAGIGANSKYQGNGKMLFAMALFTDVITAFAISKTIYVEMSIGD